MIDLSIALHDNARTRPILDGRIMPRGARFHSSIVHGSEMFWRQLKFADFDVSEMSISSLLIALSRGDDRWVGLPVFTMRRFFHVGIIVRDDRGIETPRDLIGKRVGVPEYQQTSAVWSRGILEEEFGVSPRSIEWFMERGPDRSHGGTTGFVPPEGVAIHQIAPETNIGEMMVRGELDATLLYLRDKNLVDRSTIDLLAQPGIRYLFRDQAAERRRYYTKTSLFPINHAMILRRSLFERHPWLALNIYSAFVEAAQRLADDAAAYVQPFADAGLVAGDVMRTMRKDPMAYGVREARPVLETVARYVHAQGLTPDVVPVDAMFAPALLET